MKIRKHNGILYRVLAWLLVASMASTHFVGFTYAGAPAAEDATQKQLACTLAEHIHTQDTCYVQEKTLGCKIEETEGHAHGESCYAEVPVLICGEEEVDAHSHTDACLGEKELVCELEVDEGHQHGEACLDAEGVQICTQEEREAHTHGESCYEQSAEIVCGLVETEGHAHSEACSELQLKLVCEEEETEPHAHTEECYVVEEKQTCTLPEHTHTDTCYEAQEETRRQLKPELCEYCNVELTEDAVHGEECPLYKAPVELCEHCSVELTENAVHAEGCLSLCSCEPVEGVHQKECARYVPACTCDPAPGEGEPHEETCDFYIPVAICEECKQPVNAHDINCSEIRDHLTVEKTFNNITVTAEGLLPNTIKLNVALPEAGFVPKFDQLTQELLFACDITLTDAEGNEWQPPQGEPVTLTVSAPSLGLVNGQIIQLYHVHEGVTKSLGTVTVKGGLLTFEIDGFSTVYATSDGYVEFTQKSGTVAAGKYRLLQDVTLASRLDIKNGSTVTIDLNGHVLEGSGKAGIMKNAGLLTIEDSNPNGGPYYFEKKTDGPWIYLRTGKPADMTDKPELYAEILGGIMTGGRDKTASTAGQDGGGAIQMGAHTPSQKLTITGGTVVGNSSTRAGGAFYGGTVRIEGGAIKGNFGYNWGGAVSISGAFEMIGGLIEENHTSPDSEYNKPAKPGSFYDNAQVIIGGTSSFEMRGGQIIGNVSTVKQAFNRNLSFIIAGGKIDGNFRILNKSTTNISDGIINGTVFMMQGICNVSGNAVIENGYDTKGGAVYLGKTSEGTSQFNMSGGTIRECEAENGGAVYLDGGSFSMTGGTIQSCTATNNGGAVYLTTGTFTMDGGTIQNCTAAKEGGAVYLGGSGTVSVKKGAIQNCSAVNGGAAYMKAGTFTMSGGTIDACIATGNGGAVYLPGGSFKMTGGTIQNCTAAGNGGAVYLNGSSLSVEGTAALIQGNQAVNGAGIYLSGGTPGLLQGTLAGNIASGNGGGMYIDKQQVSLAPTGTVTFQGNKAANGAGLYVAGTSGTPAGFGVDAGCAGKVVFAGNTATASGGGVCLSYGDMAIAGENIALYGNAAQNGGGAAVLNGNFELSGGTVGAENEAENHATNGGGVYVSGGNAIVSGQGQILNSSAENGGGVYVSGGNAAVSGQGQILNNSAINGGGVYLAGGQFTLDSLDAWVKDNSATNGGGVYLSSNPNLLAGSIANNTATDGGGIYVAGADVTLMPVEQVSITGNTAYANGGGLVVSGGSFTIGNDKVEFASNHAVSGGGFFVTGGDFIMYDGTIEANEADNGGGGYVSGGNVTVIDGTITANRATGDGGGMYIFSGNSETDVVMLSGRLTQNVAGGNGGGVAVVGEEGQAISVKIGCLMDHVTMPFAYSGAYETYAPHQHEYCPVVSGNTAGLGGGFYLDSTSSKLSFYCIEESGNTATDDSGCWGLGVEGGSVEIGDKDYHAHEGDTDPVRGKVQFESSIQISGGDVNVYGDMGNPNFEHEITVDITQSGGSFRDHRREATEYKVHYVENFMVGGKPTGLYIAKQYNEIESKTVSIDGALFSRDGYKITGWYALDDKGNKVTYPVGNTVNLTALKQADGMGTTPNICEICHKEEYDETLLKLYANWERKGYVIQFNANAPEGVGYTGSMGNMVCTQGETHVLSANQFSCVGYVFQGWALSPGGEVSYGSGASVKDLTLVDSSVVPLYAKWAECTHTGSLTHTASGNIITQICELCGGHSATASVSAWNVEYDEAAHPAIISRSANWIEVPLTVTYVKEYDAAWDATDTDGVNATWGGSGSSQVPVHAGTYTASVTAGGASVSAVYTITPLKWMTPAPPVYSVNKQGGALATVTVTSPTGDSYEYRKVEQNGAEDGNWQDGTNFEITKFNTYYYFQVRQRADRNHEASDASQSMIYLSESAEAIVYFDYGTGIRVEPAVSAGDGKFSFIATPENGYHKRDWKVNVTAKDAGGTVLSENVSVAKENNTYSFDPATKINEINVAGYYIGIAGVAPNPTVMVKSKNGDAFSDFNTETVTISRDSSFTLQYKVTNYLPAEYSKQSLVFSSALPENTTLILRDHNGSYWHHRVNGSVNEIDLADFTAMGGTGKFAYATTGEELQNFTYQFVMDFSQTASGVSGTKLDVALQMTLKNPVTAMIDGVEKEISGIEAPVKAELTDSAEFGLSTNEMGNALIYTYTPSNGDASIWDNRSSALVLSYVGSPHINEDGTSTEGTTAAGSDTALPADLTLTVTTANGAAATYALKDGNKFIIPTGTLTRGTNELILTLKSELLPAEENKPNIFNFRAMWYVSPSGAGSAPISGAPAAVVEKLCLEVQTVKAPSLVISGDTKIFAAGTDSKLSVEIKWAHMPDDWVLTAYLWRKNTAVGETQGQYIPTGFNEVVSRNATSSRYEFSLSGQTPGSFYLEVVASVGEGGGSVNMLQAEYHFILIEQE